ncbi:retrovirus-related Pol polyprotein from transposon TNT 1-94 [Trichonephila clavipes]|nr:retrovirus-related Pol polyprotein from transposon TNT 1-94 [Trichonephila clavipes]
MDNFLTELGIKHDITNSYTPEMNGVAERFNLTALDGIKTLLKSSEVPHKFWGEALLCFTYAWNRICHKDSNKTPFEKYSGRKPSVLHLKPFGCLAYAGVPKHPKGFRCNTDDKFIYARNEWGRGEIQFNRSRWHQNIA